MIILYTKDGCIPTTLPNMLYLPDGSVRTDPSTFTQEEIAEAGWVVAPERPDGDSFDYRTHKVFWNTETSEYEIAPLPEDEIARTIELAWRGIRSERQVMLDNTDFIVVKSLERGEPVPTEWVNYRQALRDITDTDSDPRDIVFPTQPS